MDDFLDGLSIDRDRGTPRLEEIVAIVDLVGLMFGDFRDLELDDSGSIEHLSDCHLQGFAFQGGADGEGDALAAVALDDRGEVVVLLGLVDFDVTHGCRRYSRVSKAMK